MVCAGLPTPVHGQDLTSVRGRVLDENGSGVSYASVELVGRAGGIIAGEDGFFVILRVPAGPHQVVVSRLGYLRAERSFTASADTPLLEVVLDVSPIAIDEVSVQVASRRPERIVEAPAAVSVVEPEDARRLSVTGQVPLALAQHPGVDLVQSDVTDFNINARGFNTSLNRRVLVLQDGRDVSLAFLGSQEWSAFSMPLEDIARMELVRGPGSALYGANAFAGVLDIRTPSARQTVGTKVTVGGGTLASLRADVRHAGLIGDGTWAYRVNVGYTGSDTWNRSRTGVGDLADEYSEAAAEEVTAPAPGFELRPVAGQIVEGPVGTSATGTPDRLSSLYATTRLDRYGADGSEFTVELGGSEVQNEIVVTGAGRIQRDRALRPWARVAWGNTNWNVMGWYSGRVANDPGWSLATNTPIDDRSHVVHGEVQHNQLLWRGRGRIVVGGSLRNSFIDTRETLLAEADDARNDLYGSLYGQLDFDVSPKVRLMGAARFDQGSIFDAEFSPKAAIVYQPTFEQAFRLSVNRAFQIPNTLELFVNFPAGPPVDLSALEQGLRASPLGPALAPVPEGELFTVSNVVPILALGNPELEPERVTSIEVGYRRQLADRISFSIDTYYSRLTNFVTDLLPGVNPAFAPWTADPRIDADAQPAVEDAVLTSLVSVDPAVAAGFTRLPGGETAIVFSLGNAGAVDEWGLELATTIVLSEAFTLEANYSLFAFDVDSSTVVPGDQVLPNTPEHKFKTSLAYAGDQGLTLRADARFVSAYDWASGVFVGPVPASQTVDLSGGFAVSDRITLRAVATNVFDQQRYHLFGGSVVQRRILGSITVAF